MTQSWQFSAVDTLFFRESRPMESIGGSELDSIFPPPPRTLIGAIRTAIGEAESVNWTKFKTNDDDPVRRLIGYGDNLANLSFEGVWIHRNGQRLYPVPGNLLGEWSRDRISKLRQVNFLCVGSACCCDLGNQVRLPLLPEKSVNDKPLSDYWLQKEDFESILNGHKPDTIKLIAQQPNRNKLIALDKYQNRIPAPALYQAESRLGIARDNTLRTVKKGLLYQTRHLRLEPDISLVMDVKGLSEHYSDRLNRLGGEGRLAHIQIKTRPPFVQAPRFDPTLAHGLIIYLLTSALIQSEAEYQPLPGFHCEQTEAGQTIWRGQLGDITLTLHSAVIGKVIREGGWNMVEHRPRTVQSLVPAGSVFYCTVEGDTHTMQTAIDTLHGSQIGAEQNLGRGKIAVGLWLHEYNQETREQST